MMGCGRWCQKLMRVEEDDILYNIDKELHIR